MNPIRTNNLYISSQLHRWLKWVAEMEQLNGGDKTNGDAVAEYMLRKAILNIYPGIEQLEQDYWTARNKLDSETVNKLKLQTTPHKPM